MIAEFEAAGFESAPATEGDKPDMLVVAFDMTLAYPRLCHAAWLAAQGIPYVATNPDHVCRMGIGVVLMCILSVGKEADYEMKQLKESEDN